MSENTTYTNQTSDELAALQYSTQQPNPYATMMQVRQNSTSTPPPNGFDVRFEFQSNGNNTMGHSIGFLLVESSSRQLLHILSNSLLTILLNFS